ncbi:hypothetical protein PG989_011744 [Apiospora arundinis]
MAIFHPFPRLPPVLRALVWQMTVEVRVVDLDRSYTRSTLNHRVKLHCLLPSAPVPAVLQTCRETRNLGLYQRQCSEIFVALPDYPSQYDAMDWVLPDQPLRYIWLNWDTDTIDIGLKPISVFSPIATRIKRLRMERVWDGLDESEDLCSLVNVEEIHIMCVDGLREWVGLWEERLWPCENVFFIDDADGETMRAAEIDSMPTVYWEENERDTD